MKASIFITRDLPPNSALHQLTDKYQIQGSSLLRFKTIKVDRWPECDWIFFYSQQGVHHFCKQSRLPGNMKIAAFGKKTSLKCESVGMSVQFTGDGQAVSTARGLHLVAKDQRVLFVRAKNSRRSVQKVLGPMITTEEVIVYDNVPKKHVASTMADILIFTSPLNVKAYFSKHSLQGNQQVIAIGQTTANSLNDWGVLQVKVPVEASEEAMVKLINSFDIKALES